MYRHKNGVTLTKLEFTDLNILRDLKNESWFGTHRTSFVNSRDQQEWYERVTSSSECLYLTASATMDAPLSKVGLYKISNIDWISRRYDSAHDVFDFARGKGFSHKVLEAGVDFGFEVLGMHRLDTEVLENNLASMKSAKLAGFIEEGRRRRAVFKCGSWLDSVVMGILREDWCQLDRVQEYGGVCNLSYTPKDKGRGNPQ